MTKAISFRGINQSITTQEDYDLLMQWLRGERHKLRAKRIYVDTVLVNGKPVYTPLNLQIVSPNEKEQVFRQEFATDTNMLGKGLELVYKYLRTKYANFMRDEVKHFLNQHGEYQITRPITKVVKKPIVADYPNHKWAADLIDMDSILTHNQKHRYILNCIDIFSRYVFLERLKSKDATHVREAFERICQRANVTPALLTSDNGGEFQGQFSSFCEENRIKQLFTDSHSPSQNAVVERSNKDIRKIMSAFFVRHQNKQWFNILPDIEKAKNTSFNSTIKAIPEEIWTSTNQPVRHLPAMFGKRHQARQNILQDADRKLQRYKMKELQVGDIVRVKATLWANVRKRIKEGRSKELVITWSPELFMVQRIIRPRKNALNREKYHLSNADDELITDSKGKVKAFYSSDLMLYEQDANDLQITMDDALKLNGVESNANDLRY